MMNIYSIPNILVSIYTLILGIVVIRANKNSRINQLCFLLTLVCFFWLFGYGIMYLHEDYDKAIRLAKVGHAAAVVLVPTVYWFMLEVLGTYKKKIDIYLAVIATAIAGLALLLAYSSTSYFAGISKHYWGYYPVGGIYMLLYTIWTFMVASRAIYLLNQASHKAAKELKYETYLKFKYYTLSLTVFMFAVVDFLPKFGLKIYPFGFIFVGAFSSLITYAIVRHRLLDVQIIIRRSFVYSLLITIITFIYLTIILLSEHFFRTYFGYASIMTAILTSSIVAFAFNPLRLRIQKIIDRGFFQIDPEKLELENTKLKKAVQEQDHMKAVATLAAGMAHEIKNPLTSIKTFVEFLPKKYDDPDFREKFTRIVVDEVDRVNNIVRQLLEFSKPSPPRLKAILISDVLDETLALLTSNLLKREIILNKEFDKYAIILADKNQLKQAFLNLLLNSIQSMPQGGKLTVSCITELKGRVRISFIDTGCGIENERLGHIFDPFHTTKEEGTGLGLAIVHSIITKHGGKIEVQSEVERGTTVNVFLKSPN